MGYHNAGIAHSLDTKMLHPIVQYPTRDSKPLMLSASQ